MLNRFGRSIGVCSLALLVVALGVGVPIENHTHHDSDVPHVGAPGHGHGLVLVQHEMRLERAVAPNFVPTLLSFVTVAPATPAFAEDLPAVDDDPCDSRAPPAARPRAPPA